MADASREDIARISGPDSMAKPPQAANPPPQGGSQNASSAANPTESQPKPKKKRNRGGKKKRNRRQSFIAPSEATEDTANEDVRPSLLEAERAKSAQQASFYRLQNGNGSDESLQSEALLDHRGSAALRSRRDTVKQGFSRAANPFSSRHYHRSSEASNTASAVPRSRLGHTSGAGVSEGEEEEDHGRSERTPLLGNRNRSRPEPSRNNSGYNYGSHGSNPNRARRSSGHSKSSSKKRLQIATTTHTLPEEPHDVNNPPSVPGSPTLGSMDDIFLAGAHSDRGRDRDAVINIDDGSNRDDRYSSASPEGMRRRPTVAELAERDVCFPGDEALSENAVEEELQDENRDSSRRPRRRRARVWPDIEVLDEWSREEKEERTQQDMQRAKKISEPVMVGGRLRPTKQTWHREEDDSPFRFTYFNETLDGTIHARNISDLQDDMTFRELFLPDPVELSESDDDDEDGDGQDENSIMRPALHHQRASSDGGSKPAGFDQSARPSIAPNGFDPNARPGLARTASTARTASIVSKSVFESAPGSGNETPKASPKRYGPRPTFWLDVLKPTETEMKVLAKAFGIHQLTSEDILMDEPREKVELFPSYYFVNYRTFEQDKDSEDYMEPINMYVVVFRNGVISFHHSMSPHPANVRRRIRQLNDYMSPTADWISYAIIDDVTDVYGPLVTEIEKEVDEIDEDILYMHTTAADAAEGRGPNKQTQEKGGDKGRRESGPKNQADMGAAKADGEKTTGKSGGDMLRRVGEGRKKVMGLYRLLGNKADVIKGFAKRCNEHWEVAPRSEIGLYLGDIQDHIVTMTGNLSHFESLLNRAHANYVAQINIRMNERAEQNADVLGKLTVLGTIVLPMNIITGMWGMNVWVPGQEYEGDLTWFWCITAGLVAFGMSCYFIARKVYGIV